MISVRRYADFGGLSKGMRTKCREADHSRRQKAWDSETCTSSILLRLQPVHQEPHGEAKQDVLSSWVQWRMQDWRQGGWNNRDVDLCEDLMVIWRSCYSGLRIIRGVWAPLAPLLYPPLPGIEPTTSGVPPHCWTNCPDILWNKKTLLCCNKAKRKSTLLQHEPWKSLNMHISRWCNGALSFSALNNLPSWPLCFFMILILMKNLYV